MMLPLLCRLRPLHARSLAAALAVWATSSISAQTQGGPDLTWEAEIAKNLVPYHQLTVADFRVDDHQHPAADYTVKTFIDPQYHYVEGMSSGGTIYTSVADWTVFSGLDKNETVRNSSVRNMKEQLPYAQALLDLGEIRARELAALTPAQLPSAQGDTFQEARANLDEKIKALCSEKFAQAQAEMEAFEKATRKGRDRKKVQELGSEIKRRLDALPPVPTPSPGLTPTPAASASASGH